MRHTKRFLATAPSFTGQNQQGNDEAPVRPWWSGIALEARLLKPRRRAVEGRRHTIHDLIAHFAIYLLLALTPASRRISGLFLAFTRDGLGSTPRLPQRVGQKQPSR